MNKDNTAFDQEYNQLNDQQKQAVDEIEGPILVVAGPGTGKTQLLSMRVANILRKTDTDAKNILCLTFTNKAALNMRERILLLSSGEAKDVSVKTFHSFAGESMSLYSSYFWNGAKLTNVPDAIVDNILIEILTELPLSNPLALRFAGQFTGISKIKDALKLTKEAGLTPDKLKSLVNINLTYIDEVEPLITEILAENLSFKNLNNLKSKISQLPKQGIDNSLLPLTDLSITLNESLDFAISKDTELGKTTNTGKWKQALVQNINGKKVIKKERDKNIWWGELANVYKLYREALHNRGFYDYSDMLIEVISVLEQNPMLRADIQENYNYVMIDEFQDSNAAQMRLAHLISSNDATKDSPNLMVVGDDDQSIYKFNGAELANMLTFQKNYKDVKTIVLTDNYRSSQEILDKSTEVINRAEDRLTKRDPSIIKHLIAKNPPAGTSQISLFEYLNQEHQYQEICKKIKIEYASQKSVAVLARNNDSLQQIAYSLTKEQIPINFQEKNNVLDNEIIITIHGILSLLVSIKDGDMLSSNFWLSQVLRHPMWKIEPYELWELATKSRHKSWLQTIHSGSHGDQLKLIIDWLLWLNQQVATEPLLVIINYILGLIPSKHLTSPIRGYYIDSQDKISTEYVQGLSAINLLINLTSEFSKLSTGKVRDFVNLINISNDGDKIIADESNFVSGKGGVELMSIHKAKGLEFDSVFIIDLIDKNWKPKAKSRLSPQNLPLQPAFDDMDDYVRLLYVAMTRAKQNLILSYYAQDEKGKDTIATPLISGIIEAQKINAPNNEEIKEILETAITWPRLSIEDEKLVLAPRLENFSLSVSALLDFLDVSRGGPNSFKENYLLSLPSAQTPHMAFGTAMHSSLEYGQILTNNKKFSVDAVIEYFKKSILDQSLSLTDQERFFEYGSTVLLNLFSNNSFWFPEGSQPEQAITDVLLGKAKLYGKLDRIDKNEDTLTVVDYKTGKPFNSLNTKDQTKVIAAWRYKTQLTFYALLAKHSPNYKSFKHIKCQLLFVEAATPKELIREYTPSPEEIESLEKLIKTVWAKITNLDFPKISQFTPDINGIQDFMNSLNL